MQLRAVGYVEPNVLNRQPRGRPISSKSVRSVREENEMGFEDSYQYQNQNVCDGEGNQKIQEPPPKIKVRHWLKVS
jgi:hypothetical protein